MLHIYIYIYIYDVSRLRVKNKSMVTRTLLNVTIIRTLSCDFRTWFMEVNDNMLSIIAEQLLALGGSMI